jgi:hypothetical protein
MRFEHEGRSLWYGTPDAPAPEESVQAGAEIAITIGVSPVDASNKVELLYRINQDPTAIVAAKWLQNDPSGRAQYFRARLPALRAGDIVEYIPVCHCAGRQLPSPDQARRFASSIRVTDPLSQREARKATLGAVSATSPTLANNPMLQGEYINLYASQAELAPHFRDRLAQRPGFDTPGVVQDIQTTLQLGRVTHNSPGLVAAIRAALPGASLRDLVNLAADDWKRLIEQGVAAGTITIPDAIPGASQPVRINNYVDCIMKRLRTACPTADIAQAVANASTVDLGLGRMVTPHPFQPPPDEDDDDDGGGGPPPHPPQHNSPPSLTIDQPAYEVNRPAPPYLVSTNLFRHCID